MADAVCIHDLRVQTRIGVPAEERKSPQELLLTIEMHTSLRAAGTHDDLSRSIDYDAVAKAVQELAGTERKTVEKFAEDVAEMILARFHPESVSLTVRKFALKDAAAVSISILRP